MLLSVFQSHHSRSRQEQEPPQSSTGKELADASVSGKEGRRSSSKTAMEEPATASLIVHVIATGTLTPTSQATLPLPDTATTTATSLLSWRVIQVHDPAYPYAFVIAGTASNNDCTTADSVQQVDKEEGKKKKKKKKDDNNKSSSSDGITDQKNSSASGSNVVGMLALLESGNIAKFSGWKTLSPPSLSSIPHNECYGCLSNEDPQGVVNNASKSRKCNSSRKQQENSKHENSIALPSTHESDDSNCQLLNLLPIPLSSTQSKNRLQPNLLLGWSSGAYQVISAGVEGQFIVYRTFSAMNVGMGRQKDASVICSVLPLSSSLIFEGFWDEKKGVFVDCFCCLS